MAQSNGMAAVKIFLAVSMVFLTVASASAQVAVFKSVNPIIPGYGPLPETPPGVAWGERPGSAMLWAFVTVDGRRVYPRFGDQIVAVPGGYAVIRARFVRQQR